MDEVIRIEVDGEGTIVGVDDAAVTLLGVESGLLTGRHVTEIVNVNDRDRFVERFGVGDGRLPSDAEPLVVRLVDHRDRSIWVEILPHPDGDAGAGAANAGTLALSARAFRRGEPLGIDMADPDPYHALVQRSADIVMTVDPEGTVRFANTAMVRLLGMEPDDLVDTQILDIVHPDDHDALTELVVRLLEHPAEPCAFEFRARHADGSYRWIDGWLQNLLDHPDVGGLLGNGRDVTDRHHAQAALASSEERFRSLASSSPSAIFELDGAGSLLFANDRWRDVTGRNVADTADIFGVLLPSDGERLRRMWAAGASRTGLDENVRVVRPDGAVRWVELRTRPVADADADSDASSITHVGSLHDVTEIRRAHADLEHLAMHDPLTDLPNRAKLLDRLESAVREIAESDDLLALLFVDLDRFKVVNDSLGHHAGDQVLIAVAERLVDLVRPTDLVARFGGDEFVVLCESIVDADQIVALADRIRREVAGGVDLDGERVHVSVSVGVVIGDLDSSPEALLRDADAAMYAAKSGGRDRALVFDETMHRAAVERLSVETGLRRALERDEFRLYFQPIVDVTSGAVVGVEALVRWQHPERGLLEPADFLGVAEESGLLRDLGTWILEGASGAAATWPSPTHGSAPDLFVNLAAVQLARVDLVETVGRVVADTGFEASRLVLEVTEGMLMTGASETAELLGALRELGARVAIDDFGTGYSSLSYLTRLPVDVLKIDQSFVSGLAESPKDREVTGAIVALAHALGLATVAEGVEDAGQLAALASLGCDLAQGYWFSEPVPADALAALLTG